MNLLWISKTLSKTNHKNCRRGKPNWKWLKIREMIFNSLSAILKLRLKMKPNAWMPNMMKRWRKLVSWQSWPKISNKNRLHLTMRFKPGGWVWIVFCSMPITSNSLKTNTGQKNRNWRRSSTKRALWMLRYRSYRIAKNSWRKRYLICRWSRKNMQIRRISRLQGWKRVK